MQVIDIDIPRQLRDQIKELEEEKVILREAFTVMSADNKELRTMNENLRAQLDFIGLKLVDLQRVYDKCIARLRALGEFKI